MPEYNFKFDWNKISTLGKVRILVEQVVGSPSQAQISQAVADYIDSHPGSISGLSEAAKVALLQIAQKVAYIDGNGQDYYDALYNAFYPPAELTGITAVYTQSGTIYDTDTLDDLKPDLVVTALYSDSTSEVITSGYTLSGTLTEGTSTITVAYSGQTATFTVTVTHNSKTMLYNWDFTTSYTDTIQGQVAVPGHKIGADPVRDEFGLHVTTSTGYVNLGEVYQTGITVEIDFGDMDHKQTNHARLLMVGSEVSNGLTTGFIYRNTGAWSWYASGSWATNTSVTDANIFSNKTLKAVFDDSGYMTVYADDTLIGTSSRAFTESAGKLMQICAFSGTGTYCSFYDMTVKALRIYRENE